MGNAVIATTLADGATLTPSSEAGSLLAANLKLPQPTDIWRTTAAGGSLVVDLGDVTDINLAALLYTNVTGNDGHNLIEQSEDLDLEPPWTKSHVTVTKNAIADSTGILRAEKIVEDSATDFHLLRQFIGDSLKIGDIYEWGYEVKAAELSKGLVNLQNTAFPSNGEGQFNLSTKSIVKGAGAISASIEELSDDWFRVSVIVAVDKIGDINGRIFLRNDAGESSYTGDGTSGLYVSRAQLTLNPGTPYAKTTTIHPATWRVRGANTETSLTSAPLYDSGALTAWSQSGLGDWPFVHLLHWIPTIPKRMQWWRFDIFDTDNADGYFQAGRLILADAWQAAFNIQFGWNMQVLESSIVDRSTFGHLFAEKGKARRLLTMDFEFQTEDEMYTNLFEIQRSKGLGGDVLAIRDPQDTKFIQAQTVYGLMSLLSPIIHTDFQIFSSKFTVEEMI